MAAEIVAGVIGHSLALLADAGHLLTDAAGLAFALTAPVAAVFGARATLVGAAALGAAVTLSAFFLPGMRAIERTGGRRQGPWHVPVDATD